jgi:metallo-beta-lactamase class B
MYRAIEALHFKADIALNPHVRMEALPRTPRALGRARQGQYGELVRPIRPSGRNMSRTGRQLNNAPEKGRTGMKRFLVIAAVLALATPALAPAQEQGQRETRPARTAADMAPLSVAVTGQSRPIRASDAGGMAPAVPFQLAGNTYYVGTLALGSFLIKTSAGYILIDGGYWFSPPAIEANLDRLGVKLRDIKILLNTHAHTDHAGGLQLLKKHTGAQVIASAADTPVLEAGTYSKEGNPAASYFPAVKIDRTVKDGEKITLGDTTLTAHVTPGHTEGCTNWSWPVVENGKTYNLVLVCSPSMYRAVAAKNIKADIALNPHVEKDGYAEKRTALLAARAKGSTVNPFVDPAELARRAAARPEPEE